MKSLLIVGVLALATAGAWATPAGTVLLPDSSSTTDVTATVAEQATVSVPATMTFTVNDITASTPVNGTPTVSLTNVVLNDAHSVKVSVEANAASFGGPANLLNTYAAGDISWDAPTPDSGSGASGTLDNTAFHAVGTSDTNVGSFSTGAIPFSLAPRHILVAGDYTMTLTWKVESI